MLKVGKNLEIDQISRSIFGKLHHAHCSSIVFLEKSKTKGASEGNGRPLENLDELFVIYYHAIKEANRDQRLFFSRKPFYSNKKNSDAIASKTNIDAKLPQWSEPRPMPDPSKLRFDGNPVLWVAPDTKRLWLFYNVGFGWSFCWIKYRYSDDFGKTWSKPKLLYPFISRGVKNPPIMLKSGRYILPAYVEFKFLRGVFFYSDNKGKSWKQSKKVDLKKEIIPEGYEDKKGRMVEQPTLIERKDGSLLALFRNDGRPMKKMLYAESYDGGETWTKADNYILPNPAGGFYMGRLKSGNLGIIYNHAPAPDNNFKWRNPLSFAISDDEGKSWKWRRNILEWHPDSPENNERPFNDGSYNKDKYFETFEYPTYTTDSKGEVHATWSHSHVQKFDNNEIRVTNIRYTHFSEEWVKEKEFWEDSFE
ncbi:MAG: exo-alpha-sialidase [Promethearchaeota archaeon]